ncbi:MAG: hypothetical protein ABSH47_21820 [Bryobacteraceae bacterium]
MNSQWRMRARFAPAGVTTNLHLQTAEGVLWLETETHAGGQGAAWKEWYAQALRSSCMLAGLLGAVVAMMAFVFAAWSLTADLSWTSAFPWRTGPLSHWLTWCAMGAPPRIAASLLGRRTRG